MTNELQLRNVLSPEHISLLGDQWSVTDGRFIGWLSVDFEKPSNYETYEAMCDWISRY